MEDMTVVRPARTLALLGERPYVRGHVIRRYTRVKLAIALSDVLCLEAALYLASLITYGMRPIPVNGWLLLVASPLIYLTVFAAFRLYSISRLAAAEEFRRIIAAVSVSVGSLVVVAFWSQRRYTRLLVGLSWVLALLLTLAARRLWHWWMKRQRAAGRLAYRTLIVGTNDEARGLVEAMRPAFLGFRVIGCVPTRRSSDPRFDGLPVYGSVERIQEAIRESGADCVFVASSAVTPEEMTKVTKAVRVQGVEVRVSANLSDILSTRLTVQPIGSVMALSLNPVRLTGMQAAMKRTIDLVVSFVALVVSLPLWGVIALAIRIDTKGPVLYRQERAGLRGRPFHILKFRTMVVGAESLLESLKPLNEATGPLFKLRNDPRITRVGRWLRKWSLDELPQLWNVLRGEMSMVGPRPPLPEEVARYEDWHMDRQEVRPGITGLWQVRGRSQLPFDDYVRLDLFYIENWSVAYDLFILAKTIPAILTRKGAF
jgi:exopolysaccharide biosynthesis polyprenyl glycosylphosphotransferase